MVTVSVSAPREEGFLPMAPLLRAILVVEHDPSQGEPVTRHFSFKPHQYAKRATSSDLNSRAPSLNWKGSE